MTDVTNLLQELGFTDYEARAYVALLKQSPLNGYELAKSSGIPRPNIYKVLQKLEEREVVIRADTPNSAVYSPIPPHELTKRLGNQFKQVLDSASEALESVSQSVERDYVWNIEGYEAILDHVRTLAEQAQESLIVAVWQPESRQLSHTFADALERKVEVQTLCLQDCPQACGDCRGAIYRYPVVSSQQTRWLIVVQDGVEMVMADIQAHANGHNAEVTAQGIRTRQKYLSQLAIWYIRHSIALASILSSADNNLTALLSSEIKNVLQTFGPGEDGWSAYMQQLRDQ